MKNATLRKITAGQSVPGARVGPDLTSPEKCMAYLRSLGDAEVSIAPTGRAYGRDLWPAAADAVTGTAGIHAKEFGNAWGRWTWRASELVVILAPKPEANQ